MTQLRLNEQYCIILSRMSARNSSESYPRRKNMKLDSNGGVAGVHTYCSCSLGNMVYFYVLEC